jgi:hypothetical protein
MVILTMLMRPVVLKAESVMHSQEIVEMFASLSGHGLQSVAEDMGLEQGDLLMLDSSYSEEEKGILDMEVTPEMRNILEKGMFADAFVDLTKGEKERDEVRHLEDDEKKLNTLLDVQERMAKGMNKFIVPTSARVALIQDRLDSAKQGNYLPREKFMELVGFLKTHRSNLSKYWETWKELKAQSDEIVGENRSLWAFYFNLGEEDMNRYFTTGETEDVDDYSLLANDSYAILEMLQEAHGFEMKEFEAPESRGNGFWNFREQYKAEKRAIRRQEMQDESDAFWQSIEKQEEQEMYLF